MMMEHGLCADDAPGTGFLASGRQLATRILINKPADLVTLSLPGVRTIFVDIERHVGPVQELLS